MNAIVKYLPLAAAAIALGGCAAVRKGQPADSELKAPSLVIGSSPVAAMPMAVVYRTSGNYADNVPVTLNAAGDKVVSYPAPTDLTAGSTPVDLGGGFLLDRRGIGPMTAFTRYTYDEYRAMKNPPSAAELLGAVIPGAVVTEIYRLPITASEAIADPSKCRSYVADGFKGCEKIAVPKR